MQLTRHDGYADFADGAEGGRLVSRVMRVHRGSQPLSDPAGDSARWTGWRLERLLAAGFQGAAAQRLAADARIDVHALLELVDHGCPPHLAARIMAPLDWEPCAR